MTLAPGWVQLLTNVLDLTVPTLVWLPLARGFRLLPAGAWAAARVGEWLAALDLAAQHMTAKDAWMTLALWVLLVALWETLPVWAWQGTLFQRLFRYELHTRVPRPGSVSFGRTLTRATVKILGTLFFGWGLLCALATPTRRPLHDIVAGTYLVRLPRGRPVADEAT